MKKVKIMLTAIAALGIVGGALALKAKRVGEFIYCTTTNLNAAVCSLPVAAATIIGGGNLTFKYITVNVADDCKDAPLCSKRGRIITQ